MTELPFVATLHVASQVYVVSSEGGNDLVLPVLTMLQSLPVQLVQLVHNARPAEQISQRREVAWVASCGCTMYVVESGSDCECTVARTHLTSCILQIAFVRV